MYKATRQETHSVESETVGLTVSTEGNEERSQEGVVVAEGREGMGRGEATDGVEVV